MFALRIKMIMIIKGDNVDDDDFDDLDHDESP